MAPQHYSARKVPSHMVLLDSGAYTAWSKGKAVDLAAYIEFCKSHPNVSYYVNLDVIPGAKGRTPTRDEIEAACKQGWQNYKTMIQHLPANKVLPVVHRSEDPRWLEKYLNAGVTYIGISPGTKATMAERLGWLRGIRSLVLRPNGDPIVQMHGFGIAASRLLFHWRWHTVDSSIWIMEARVGKIMTPRRIGRSWDYRNPADVQVSTNSPRSISVGNGSPVIQSYIKEYLETVGVPLGRNVIREVKAGYILQEKETWVRKNRTVCMAVEEGVCNNESMRRQVNVAFLKRQALIAPVDAVFMAGGLSTPAVEESIDHRLVTFADMAKKTEYACFQFHYDRLKGI